MRKMVVFNVGGALCSYLEIGENRIMVDLGSSDSFNPVTDFLVPHFKRNGHPMMPDGKYRVTQLVISHPHIDHLNAICDFDDLFSPDYVTCPNDKTENDSLDVLDMSQFDNETEEVKRLKRMYQFRHLPLRPSIGQGGDDRQYLFYLHPKNVEDDKRLSSGGECYQNNVSLVNLFVINGHHILLPGDIMSNGMETLINDNPELKRELQKHRLCVLVAPHHGLRSSFPTSLFNTIKDGKTRCLNIVSEKVNNPNDTRVVDSRYSSSDFCDGDNDLDSQNGSSKNYQRKTSQGHVCIDFSNGSRPDIRVIDNTDELIDWFSE